MSHVCFLTLFSNSCHFCDATVSLIVWLMLINYMSSADTYIMKAIDNFSRLIFFYLSFSLLLLSYLYRPTVIWLLHYNLLHCLCNFMGWIKITGLVTHFFIQSYWDHWFSDSHFFIQSYWDHWFSDSHFFIQSYWDHWFSDSHFFIQSYWDHWFSDSHFFIQSYWDHWV